MKKMHVRIIACSEIRQMRKSCRILIISWSSNPFLISFCVPRDVSWCVYWCKLRYLEKIACNKFRYYKLSRTGNRRNRVCCPQRHAAKSLKTGRGRIERLLFPAHPFCWTKNYHSWIESRARSGCFNEGMLVSRLPLRGRKIKRKAWLN